MVCSFRRRRGRGRRCRSVVSSVAGRPVRVRKTSSSVGRRRPTSSSSIRASASRRTASARRAVPSSTGTATRRAESSTRGASLPSGASSSTARPRSSCAADADLDDVAPGQRLQLVGRAGGDRPAVVDDDDVVGELVGLLEVLRGQQHVGAAADEGADGVPQLDPAARVEAGRRLVEEQQPRGADEAGPEVEAAAHPARVVAHQAVAVVGQAELGEHGVGGARGPPAGRARTAGRPSPGSPARSAPARRRRAGRRGR